MRRTGLRRPDGGSAAAHIMPQSAPHHDRRIWRPWRDKKSQGVKPGERMTYTATTAGTLSSRYSMLFISRLAPGIAALSLAAAAAWIGGLNPVSGCRIPLCHGVHAWSFDDRFQPDPTDSPEPDFAQRFPDRSLSAEIQVELEQAKRLLAENLKAGNWQAAPLQNLPIPRHRP